MHPPSKAAVSSLSFRGAMTALLFLISLRSTASCLGGDTPGRMKGCWRMPAHICLFLCQKTTPDGRWRGRSSLLSSNLEFSALRLISLQISRKYNKKSNQVIKKKKKKKNCSSAVVGNIDTLYKMCLNVNRNSITVWCSSANSWLANYKNEVVHYLMGYCMFYVHVTHK